MDRYYIIRDYRKRAFPKKVNPNSCDVIYSSNCFYTVKMQLEHFKHFEHSSESHLYIVDIRHASTYTKESLIYDFNSFINPRESLLSYAHDIPCTNIDNIMCAYEDYKNAYIFD